MSLHLSLQGYLPDDVSLIDDAFVLSQLPINCWEADTHRQGFSCCCYDFALHQPLRQRTGSGRERGSYYSASNDVDAHLTSPQST